MGFINLLDTLNTLFPLFMFLIIGAVAFYMYSKKKGWIKSKKKVEKEKNVHTAKHVSIQNFNIVEDLVDNLVVTENKTKYTTGLGCVGVTYNKLSLHERKMILDGYLEFYNMVDWNVQFYTQSKRMDVRGNIQAIKDILAGYEDDIIKTQGEYEQLQKVIDENPSQSYLYTDIQKDLKKKLDYYTWQIQHKKEEIAYAMAIASDDNAPQFDLYILFSYEYDASQMTTTYTNEEIIEKAKTHLDTKLNNIISVLSKCRVTATKLSAAKIAEVLHRGYNLSDSDVFSIMDKLETSSFDLCTTSNYITKLNMEVAMDKLETELLKSTDTEMVGVKA